MKKFFQDFKKFATRGNVVDMAVGVIIGSAFTAIVNSLVKDILMPLIVWLFPVQDLSNLCIVLRPESVEGAGDALTWNYGNFIMAVINFLIVAFVLFIVLRSLMNARGFVADKYPFIDKKEEKQTTEQNQVVEESKLKTLYIGSESVNLRKEANTNSEVVTKLSLNTAVDVYAEENGWSKVKVNGNEGYISSSLLSEKKKETSRSLETPRTKTSENSSENTKTSQEKETTTTVPVSGKGATAVETAKKYIGCSYVYGASGPSSFDCSGFTSYVFKQHGISLNRTAAGQYSNGVAVSRDQLQPGDLVMFGKSGINHVGIYIGGGQIVHAANKSRGVTTDTINSGYYNNNYVGARRVM